MIAFDVTVKDVNIGDKWATEFSGVLSVNTTLKKLRVRSKLSHCQHMTNLKTNNNLAYWFTRL